MVYLNWERREREKEMNTEHVKMTPLAMQAVQNWDFFKLPCEALKPQ